VNGSIYQTPKRANPPDHGSARAVPRELEKGKKRRWRERPRHGIDDLEKEVGALCTTLERL